MKHWTGHHAALFVAANVVHAAALAAATVPLTFIDGIPFTTVTVGATSSLLMIDSGGALGISIPETTIDRSGSVTLLDQTTKFRDLKGEVHEVRNLVANQVRIGATPLAPIEGRVHVQWGGAPEGPDAELTKARQAGAIGLAAFADRPVMFDYRLGRMSIYAPGAGPQAGREGWRALRLDYGKEGPNITLLVNGKPLKFVLDTGAKVNLVNAASLAPAGTGSQCPTISPDDRRCDPRTLGPIQDSDGHPLGPLTAERVQLNGAPFDGVLGAPFFRSYRVLFDLSAHRLLLSPQERGGAIE
jgi:hypothetical protein